MATVPPAFAPTTDRAYLLLLEQARRETVVVYDRDAHIGQIPENLKRYLDDPNTYKITLSRGRPAIMRASS